MSDKKYLYITLSLCSAILLTFFGCNTEQSPLVTNNLPEKVDFNIHIRPILSDRCFACHGFDNNSRKGNLRLDTKEGAFSALGDLKDHHAIVPGDLSNSEAYQRIITKDPQLKMPPINSNLKLTEEEIALIAKWIEQGAEWKKHWAFIPPEKPKLPKVDDQSWTKNPIDYFVLARLEREKLKPSSEASKEKLLRRVTLDLTGLPPTLEELDNFLNDKSQDAYEKVVDRLLAKQEYGEKMTSFWLDLARYGDTHGYINDAERTMWPWRDWVIKSFNQNLPFDQFITWQLAGDLLPKPSIDQKIATAFNRHHKISQEGGLVDEEYRVEYVVDRTNTVATAFLGLTLECARCHDHKYDPLSQKEYYQFYSFFNNIPENGAPGQRGIPAPSLKIVDNEDLKSKIDFIEEKIKIEHQNLKEIEVKANAESNTWSTQTFNTSVNPKGLIIDLPLDKVQADGTTPNLANKNQNGIVIGNSPLEPGKKGKAILFNKDNSIRIYQTQDQDFELNDRFSFGLWLNRSIKDDRVDLPLIQKADVIVQGYQGYELGISKNQVYVRISHAWPSNAIKVVSKETIPLNEWSHIMATYNGSGKAGGINIYINGKLAELSIEKDNLTKSIKKSLPILIGKGTDGNDSFDGAKIDEVKIYNRTLSSIEIASLTDKNYLQEILSLVPENRSEQQKHDLTEHFLFNYSKPYNLHQNKLSQALSEQTSINNSLQEIMVMEEMKTPRKSFILNRGVYNAYGERVYPETPASVSKFPKHLPPNRLGLAQWLMDPKNPLTARVAVNRFWQSYFGRGIVYTAENFGIQGSPPTHPELLDWLATRFIESGWNVKAMQKLIVMSATYRQASKGSSELWARDPDNKLLARGPSYRLSAEVIRDNALAISGLLVKKAGGPSVRPYQPAGLGEPAGHGEELYRRSMYTFFKRTVPHPSLITFDASSRDACIVKRQKTNTPLQSLVLLNDHQFIETSRLLAEKMMINKTTSEERIKFAFRSVTSRLPTKEELSILLEFYQRQLAEFGKNSQAAEDLLNVGETKYNKNLRPDELAANTLLSSTIFNLHETITQE